MKEEKIELPIRSALIPNFYQNFHCLAQACKDSCCMGWNITFDKKDYLRLRRLDAPEELKARLEQNVRRERKTDHEGIFYAKFDLDSNNGRCPFLNAEGLCDIQCTCGHEALPLVCTSYPRKTVYSYAAKEYTLSPSCEGVLQQLWDLPNGIEFVEDPLPKADYGKVSVVPGESLGLYFTPIREMCIDLLQNRALPLTQRMLSLGLVLQRLQKEDWAAFQPDLWERQTAALAAENSLSEIPGNRQLYLVQNIRVLDTISAQEKEWPNHLSSALEVEGRGTLGSQNAKLTFSFSIEAYERALERFQEAFSGREYFFENLMVAVALYLGFPNLNSREDLWKSYVSLCSLYSFYRFVAVLGCAQEATKEKLFHYLVMASRATLHNRQRFQGFQEELFQHESSSLAHMAILLKG